MKILKKIALLSIVLGAVSCYSPKTHGEFVTGHQDAWIDGFAIRISEHEYADKGLLYCRSNVQDNGDAKPVCFEAEFKKSSN